MLIDCHTHVTPSKSTTRANGTTYPTPDELIAKLDALGIDRSVIFPSVNPECRHRFVTVEDVIGIAEQHPDRFIPFCNIDPRMESNSPNADFSRYFEYYKQAGCKGVGEMCANLPFDDPLVENMLRQCEEHGLPLTFHIGPQQGACYGLYDELGLPRLEGALKKFPNLLFLGHSQPFWAEIGTGLTDETRRHYPKGPVQPGGRLVALFERYPNLYGDLSAGSGHNALSRDPEFGYEFMDRFQDRLLFATDISFPGYDPPLPAFFRGVREEGKISEEAAEKIAWRNADRILGLGLAES